MASMSPRYQDHHHHHHKSLLPSNSNSSTTTNSSPQPPPPLSPKPMTRSEPANPYPTTFVQADTSSFKQVVQMLTGSSETAKQASKPASGPPQAHSIPPIKPNNTKKQQSSSSSSSSGFKLYERRSSLNKNLNINPLIPVFNGSAFSSSGFNGSGFSPRKPEILSPSVLDFPSLVLSPVTPLIPDPFDRSAVGPNFGRSSASLVDAEAEEKAIKEKGFFLHPSPASTPRDSEPRLLPLFPTTSPRAASSGSSAAAAAAATS